MGGAGGDDFTRGIPEGLLSGPSSRQGIDRLVEVRGRPLRIVSDNGSKPTSRAILQWLEDQRSTGIASLSAS
jgi:putative transposase